MGLEQTSGDRVEEEQADRRRMDKERKEPLRRALAALGEEHRFRLVHLISEQPCCVSDLVEATGLPQPLVSHHLSILCRADLLRAERDGRRRVYHVNQPAHPQVRALLTLLLEKPEPPGEQKRPPLRRDDLEEYLL